MSYVTRTAFDARFAARASRRLMAEHGQVVMRRPNRVEDDAEPVEAIWEHDTAARSSEIFGDETRATGRLHVYDDQPVSQEDAWEIDGEVWQTNTVGRPSGGMRTVEIRKDRKRNVSVRS
ncbi:hypothetical protein [Alienimonas sp. DA493]|uniref:hypothetical protein n=1 Tax=Alienimonas sp. DA493 TaxID=3373605 RepID=UPI003754B50A